MLIHVEERTVECHRPARRQALLVSSRKRT